MFRITRAFIRYAWFRYAVGGVIAALGILLGVTSINAVRDQMADFIAAGALVVVGLVEMVLVNLHQKRQQRIEAETKAQLGMPVGR